MKYLLPGMLTAEGAMGGPAREVKQLLNLVKRQGGEPGGPQDPGLPGEEEEEEVVGRSGATEENGSF